MLTGTGGFTVTWFVAIFENLTVVYIHSTTASLPGSVLKALDCKAEGRRFGLRAHTKFTNTQGLTYIKKQGRPSIYITKYS